MTPDELEGLRKELKDALDIEDLEQSISEYWDRMRRALHRLTPHDLQELLREGYLMPDEIPDGLPIY